MQPLVTVQIFAEGKSDDGECILIVGADADALGGLVGKRPNVDVGVERIATHQLHGDGAEFRHGGRNMDAQDAAVLLPALVVLAGAQDEQLVFGANPVCADALKDAGPIVQSMREDVDLRVAQRHVLAIEVDDQVWIGIGFHTATSFGVLARCRW